MWCWLSFFFLAFCSQIQHPEHPTRCEAGVVCMLSFFSILCVYAHHVRDVCIVAAVRALTDWWWFYYLLILKEARCARIKIYCWVFFRSLDVFLFTVVSTCWQRPHGHSLFWFLRTAFYIDRAKNICVLGFRRMVRIPKDQLIMVPGTWNPRNIFLEWWSCA